MKKVILVVLSVLLLASFAVPAGAAAVGGNTVQPCWDNTSFVDAYFLYAYGSGYVESAVSGDFAVSSIRTDMYLYKWVNNDWAYVDELHSITYDSAAVTSLAFDANGEYFRADFTFTVTMYGVDEVIERTIYQNVGP